MTNKVFCVLAALLLSSCSNDWSAGLADKRTSASAASSTERVDPAGAPSSPIRGRAARSFAGAPDRGSLVQYPKDPVVRRTGAYTWHAADLSEDHALRSTITGDLSFTAPDGTPINLAYERHIEHPDGNWSWIGRGEGERGESTVITFGEEAAFGTIPQGRDQQPLRLTIADGRAWVVSADPRLLREIRNEATHPTKPDYLVPPKLAAETASATPGMEAMGAEAVSTTASGKTVVDVLVGFTDGYSAYRGGASAAITRIHNLIEVTNQAYRNSQLNAEVRLVHSLQVSYPDATANKTALEELTGFKAPSTRTTPASAFSPLRSARDQYGADVVVLLRRFQDPENDGCGIAWLIGGGRSGIDASDEFFGYSVVADGRDEGTDGKTYFCRDETLAHEIGHNMGSQHDADKAKKDDGSVSYGAYIYSFGYRAAAGAGNFYTVMAYGDSGQTRNRVFSNPNVSVCGIDANLVCGVADQADNARSMGNTIPIISEFRKTVVPLAAKPARNDIDGDGKSDMLWHDGLSLSYWFMDGTASNRICCQYVGPTYRPVAAGDMTGDGRVDLIWAGSSGEMHLWRSTGFGFIGEQLPFSYPGGWILFAAADVNGDGKADFLWRDGVNLSYWIMDTRSPTRIAGQYVGPGYIPLAVSDFNGDGLADILWKGSGGDMHIWTSNGTGFVGRQLPWNYPGGWDLVATGDIDGDRKADLMWYDGNTLAYWLLDGTSPVVARSQVVGRFAVVGAGDYTGDGLVDLIWKGVDGDMHLWRSTGMGFVGQQLSVNYPSGWSAITGNP